MGKLRLKLQLGFNEDWKKRISIELVTVISCEIEKTEQLPSLAHKYNSKQMHSKFTPYNYPHAHLQYKNDRRRQRARTKTNPGKKKTK